MCSKGDSASMLLLVGADANKLGLSAEQGVEDDESLAGLVWILFSLASPGRHSMKSCRFLDCGR